ncbi:MAG: ADP-ribosylglycohydrolase family protein, partial [Gammaproteobacteria bacterium]
RGMMLGLAIGDSLGNTSEGMSPSARRAAHGEIRDYLPNWNIQVQGMEQQRRGLPSDDTQLAFWTLELLICTEIGTNSGSYLYSALAHHRRESLFDNQILTAVLVGHFKVQMMGHICDTI